MKLIVNKHIVLFDSKDIVMVNGKSISLGNFFTSEGASAAYKRAANIFFKEYALHNSRETT